MIVEERGNQFNLEKGSFPNSSFWQFCKKHISFHVAVNLLEMPIVKIMF